MRFWDASGIVPLLVREAATDELRVLLVADEQLTVWWGTPVECMSAISRRTREHLLDDAGEATARRVLRLLGDAWTEVEPTRTLRSAAVRLLGAYPLRTADALQLASALAWSDGQPAGREFVCLDSRLRTAAQREGFSPLPEIWSEGRV